MIYKKEDVQRTLKDEVGWEYYGGKHCESTYTRFFQTYILPTKFNIDKRKVHYSALIRSGQMTRSEALEKIKTPQITEEEAEEQKEYVSKKLGVTVEEFEELMSHPPKTFRDYPTYLSIIRMFRVPIKVACKIGLLPDVLYEKYAR